MAEPALQRSCDETRAEVARLDGRIDGLYLISVERQRQVDAALASVDRATNKAEEAQQRVNITQNEFRGALKDQAAMLATKEDVARVVERLQMTEKWQSARTGQTAGSEQSRSNLFQVLPLLFSAAALVWAALAFFWKRA